MYTKDNFIKSLKNEVRIIKNLAKKIPEGTMDYRPTPVQRSTLELLQYLSISGAGTMKAILTGDIKVYGEYHTFTQDVDFYGIKTKVEHLIDGVLKNFAAYRMQLFLYMKSNGAYVSTMDLWAGMDTPPKQN
ncbi:MAG: hypothetical protein AB201_02690 [Parcubacteria bacterium C7867-006]|nr:MAG: hypothetical protein AB201_02690 [Parcubacteria bacterium C7867-006]